MYQSIEDAAASVRVQPEHNVLEGRKRAQHLFAYVLAFSLTFAFYFHCVFHALSPVMNVSENRKLADNNDGACTPENAAILVAVGAGVGLTVTAATFVAIGLSPIGPIAGGLFAGSMGSGIAAGSFMATIQSAAMTATTYATATAVGAAGGLASCFA